MTLYQMMQNSEPSMLPTKDGDDDILDEAGLQKLMMSPKYWKDQDPKLLQKVTRGFERLYPQQK